MIKYVYCKNTLAENNFLKVFTTKKKFLNKFNAKIINYDKDHTVKPPNALNFWRKTFFTRWEVLTCSEFVKTSQTL